MKYIAQVGDVAIDNKLNKKYRIIAIVKNNITLCEMEIKTFSLMQINKDVFLTLVSNGDVCLTNDEEIVVDVDRLTPNAKEKFKERKNMMLEVVKAYAPTFIELSGRKQKPKIDEITKRYQCPRNTFWRICVDYFQSGMKDYALVDARLLHTKSESGYQYSTKTGRPTEYSEFSGVTLTDEIRLYFEEALKDYKSGRHKTIRAAYDKMNLKHFTKTEIINGIQTIVLAPESERPTFRQFSYYLRKNITKQEKDLIKTSALEQRNNKRLIVSDSLFGVEGPGDMVEIDACEADVSLVSMVDPSKTVGRPVVYFMIDVYSRIILAMSVAFDNNSILGLTNLFLNLADNKQKYCERYGISYENKAIWPSNIIPNHVRVDRGAEFRGKEFDRICDELGIDRILVTPGSGSLKGVVEQSFHQMHSKQNVHLEDHGLIEKRHDSRHHKEATLNIEEYTRMVINFVLTHNQQCLTTYPITKDMIVQKVKPIPAILWEYGIKNGNVPRPIPSLEQYLFNLMTPIKAKVSRRGICYKDLWYLNTDDKVLAREMFDAGTKKVVFEARMDMRDVGAIYYIRDNKLVMARLNPLLSGNADYAGLTMKQYEDYLKGKKELLAEGRVNNEQLSAFTYAMNHYLVEEAQKPMLPNSKNMRPARETDKQLVSKSNKIEQRLPQDVITEISTASVAEQIELPKPAELEIVEKKQEAKKEYSNFDEALDDIWDN